MIYNQYEDYPSFIVLFRYEVEARTKSEGRKLLLPVVRRCEKFARGLEIHFHDDFFLFYDNTAVIRLVFQIKEPYDSILIKMSSLFSFAASCKLKIINNEFFPEKNR